MSIKVTTRDGSLSKAEQLFARGSFQAARALFVKAGLDPEKDPELAARLGACDQELARQRARELIKKARRSLKKGRSEEALALFVEAHAITREAWLEDRIRALQQEQQGARIAGAASAAEASGDYLAAAELYGRRPVGGPDQTAALDKARCLVMAGSWPEAISAYRDCDPRADRDLYHLGLALAMTRRYHECILCWAKIRSEHAGFVRQKEEVCELLASGCGEMLEADGEQVALFEQLKEITSLVDHPGLREALRACRNRLIAGYWRQERYDLVLDLLDEVEQMDVALLEVAAKASFLLAAQPDAEVAASRLDELGMYWLTALHDPEISNRLSRDAEQRSRMRDRLVERAEELVKSRADSAAGGGTWIVERWRAERGAVEEIRKLAASGEVGHLSICTPRFAARFGRSAAMLELIRGNRESFRDADRYLALGACYCPAAPSLFLAENGCYQQARDLLARIENQDEFARYAALRIELERGLQCLQSGDKNAVKHLASAASLLAAVPGYEDRIIRKAAEIDKDDMRSLELYERALAALVKERPSAGLRKALSTVMTDRAVEAFNRDRMGSKPLMVTLERALELDPANEAARIALGDARYNRDFEELTEALEKHRMTRACQIVERSGHQGIYDAFFEFMEEAAEELAGRFAERQQKWLILNDLCKWCAMVDHDHPVAEQIRGRLALLQRGERLDD